MLSRLLLFFVLSVSSPFSAQYFLGLGASLHRYDQVLSLNYLKGFRCGGIGVSGGLGVERSLQGAIAPQIAVFWQSPLPLKNRHYPMNMPFYALRYQFDVQHSTVTDTFHGIYFSLGYAFGEEERADLQVSLGAIAEKIYGLASPAQNKIHLFFNPQLQFTYYLSARKK